MAPLSFSFNNKREKKEVHDSRNKDEEWDETRTNEDMPLQEEKQRLRYPSNRPEVPQEKPMNNSRSNSHVDPREHYTRNNESGELQRELVIMRKEMEGISYKLDYLCNIIGNQILPNMSSIDSETRILQRIDTLVEQQRLVENQQSIIKRQHDAMVKYNDDVIYKTQKGLILELISIADQVRMVMDYKRDDSSYDLMEGLREIEESIEASLSNNSVRRYSETEENDSILNRRRQTAIGNEATPILEKDGHYKSIVPGYEWTMPYLVVNSEIKLNSILDENRVPRTFSFVIRPEEVVRLKYQAPEQTELLVKENNDELSCSEKPVFKIKSDSHLGDPTDINTINFE